ncbi:MAG: hypothetical protein JSS82_07345 [Bacteroidetes bacterium]|nr:hypothetical protein [Bacteroidota bacterium]
MLSEYEIEQLKQDLFSDNWDLMKGSSETLRDIGSEEIFYFFIELLNLNNDRSWTRNIAALRLGEIGDNRAVDPLLNAILKPENINYNGTLVYALSYLDCSRKLPELFEVLFYHGYEAKLMASEIIGKQIFEFSKGDILAVKSRWEDLELHPEKSPAFDDSKRMIEDAVLGFLPYLYQG